MEASDVIFDKPALVTVQRVDGGVVGPACTKHPQAWAVGSSACGVRGPCRLPQEDLSRVDGAGVLDLSRTKDLKLQLHTCCCSLLGRISDNGSKFKT